MNFAFLNKRTVPYVQKINREKTFADLFQLHYNKIRLKSHNLEIGCYKIMNDDFDIIALQEKFTKGRNKNELFSLQGKDER